MLNNNIMVLMRDVSILFPAFLVVFTFRGFFRAAIAKWMGDDTAQREGFLSLNPLAHVDIFGLSIVLLAIFVLAGLLGGGVPRGMLYIILIFMGVRWTYSVPFEPRNFKKFKLGSALTILGGSIGCFLLTYIFLYLQKYIPFGRFPVGVAKSIQGILGTVILLASYFGILALLPIPPFDGGRLLQVVLPYSKQKIVTWLEEYSIFILLALFVIPVISDIFFGAISFLGLLMVYLLSGLVL